MEGGVGVGQREKERRKLVPVSHVEVDRQTGCPISLEITFFVLIRGAPG